jgi:hypothetical protein
LAATLATAVGMFMNPIAASGSAREARAANNASPSLAGQFNAVSAVSATDAWAVGCSYWDGSCDLNLAEHWNGKSWTQVPVPLVDGENIDDLGLVGVAASSATDAWAVGAASNVYSPAEIVHWNGKAWTQVPIPAIGAYGTDYSLTGVAVTSATNAWAVGILAGVYSVVLHWNGKKWTRVPTPSAAGDDDQLYGVSATSATNAWAVGNRNAGYYDDQTLIFHWNGEKWTRVPSPYYADSTDNNLFGVDATSTTNAWAVGKAPALHWNGKKWTEVPSPSNGTPAGVTVTSATNAWLVGGAISTWIVRWNGKAWKEVAAPSGDQLTAVAATSSSDAWAVGYHYDSAALENIAVILHWNGQKWISQVTKLQQA